jgi:hypothetical protein
MLRSRSVLIAVLLVALLGGAACGSDHPSSSASDPNAAEKNPPGDIPDNQVFVAYHFPGGAFTVSVPEGWSRVEKNGTVTFTDKYNSVALATTPAALAPTVASATRDELPGIAASAPSYQAGKVSAVKRTGGDAVLITYRTDSPPDPVTGKSRTLAVERYEFFHGGQEIVVTLSGAKGADNVDPWRIVTDSVRFGA